ncbi:SAC3/GANP/Nin1/mts3/eIF-3 p25 family-domain-containing protein, partial [Tricladium varicosporioides]
MLSTDSNSRGARGQLQNRSKGSRGRGSTGRGAFSSTSTIQPTTTTDPFEQERLENAARREQRGQKDTMINGRGGTSLRGRSNKQVRFAETSTEQSNNPFGRAPSPAPNPFDSTSKTSSPFISPSTAPMNPFAPKLNTTSNPFASGVTSNPFGAPSQISSTLPIASSFGTPSESNIKPPPANPFGKPSTNFFGASPNPPSALAPSNSLGKPSTITFGTPSDTRSTSPSNPFGNPSTGAFGAPSTFSSAFGAIISSNATAKKIDQLLRKEGIVAPKWPKLPPGDSNFRTEIETYWRSSKDYRNKIRASLIRAGLLDDPDKPKKLSEAIDFKGTCEEMCPDFERATRIYERDVKNAEMSLASDGQSYPAPEKMIKALARSAAGQDAPLPMDIRSPAALRRTLDYLFRSLLGQDEDNLPKIHHFLWDRTRAIRRDFVFQSSMSPAELVDQIYCLERITRFHVIALHQMSKDGIVPTEEFSEQQEVEQLGKALLSLVHAYEDCNIQAIECENEAEFRAYYVLFNKNNPGILETVQDWGWKFWGESNDIKTAVSLVETLQNTWDSVGPLKPHSAIDVAQNAFSRFFTIIQDKKVSYTMACFAELHFNSVRKSILKTILAAYRKQRDQTKDWTLSKLNTYLRFDDENDIIAFGEAYGLSFEEVDGEDCLSFDSDGVSDPFPPLKQYHSYSLVEKKRGIHSLPESIDRTIYDESEQKELLNNESTVVTNTAQNRENDVEEEGLFIQDNL